MSNVYLKEIDLYKVHYRFNLKVNFHDGLNVIHGRNGAGKSTLIHVIANIVNGDFVRFAYLNFERIVATYYNDLTITIIRERREDDTYITVRTSSGSEMSFSLVEAANALKIMDEDRYSPESKPLLIHSINNFVKLNELNITSSSYFPAFRTMLEAWGSYPDNSYERKNYRSSYIYANINKFARGLFGRFLPNINYPSPIEIEEKIKEEIRRAQMGIARYESRIFSDSFVRVFSALINRRKSEDTIPDELLSEIEGLVKTHDDTAKINYYEEYSKIYEEIRMLINENSQGEVEGSVAGALIVYRDALRERQTFQEKAFFGIDKYLNSINSFLEDKEICYEFDLERRSPRVGLKFPDNTWSTIRVMSSGERQLLTMLYAASKMSEDSIVLIDEPEISLHIDWQEDLLKKMLSQLSGRQIIVCTHSPSIATGYEDCMILIDPEFVSTRQKNNDIDFDEDENV
ncbi:AAA family ATPase [Serratia fonticola]|uniref:AAA family ATPase n=1 Tax=Serratia fonticola TaxID=47917 RepID=UPI00192B0788|nr:AAA family ATPase [Serratia fonticola]MBL5906021.1 AAA family ATPase [Serratia fonticola]